jgi:hypothetical protein
MRVKWLVVGLCVGFVVTGAVAWAAIPSSTTGVITGCYSTGTGSLRVIDAQAGARCKSGERQLEWNQTGPQGLPGIPGAQGVPGPAGPAGAGAHHTEIVLSGPVQPCSVNLWQGGNPYPTQVTNSGGDCNNIPAGTVQTQSTTLDPAYWPTGAQLRLQTRLWSINSTPICARLVDIVHATPIGGSDRCFTGNTPTALAPFSRAPSAPFSLPAGSSDYVVQIMVQPNAVGIGLGQASLLDAELLVDW